MYYNERFIISGGIYEHYEYSRLIHVGGIDGVKPVGRKKGENSKVYRDDVMKKARTNIRRLVNTNFNQWTDDEENRINSKFLTLTFRKNMTDIPSANYEFTKFIQRLSYECSWKIKYIAVIEFQDGKVYKDRKTGETKRGTGRGAIHYHVVMFNMPYIPNAKLEKIWGQGFIKINKLDNVDNVGAYVCKYMTVDLDDERLVGQKTYFKSTGLLLPQDIKDYSEVQKWKSILGQDKPNYEVEFEADFLGKIKYAQYNTNKKQGVF